VLYLGEKDYQQLVVLRGVVAELLLDVEVRAVPTVREPDGVALSSRNGYLSPAEREAARAIPHALEVAQQLVAAGETSAGRIRARVEVALAEPLALETEYVELVDPNNLESVDGVRGQVRLLVAARIGSTRLIDNRLLDPTSASTGHHSPSGAPALEGAPS
jgi:pantoate--beta-alanine ligase